MKRSGSRLAQELSRQRLRHDWLADQLGVSKWTFSRIEAGLQPAPADWYARAAAILGVPIEDILPRVLTTA